MQYVDMFCSSHDCMPVYLCSLQELKGKILLKAKKIGGLEDCLDETLTDEVSDEEEMTNGDAESPSAEDPPAEYGNENDKVLYFVTIFDPVVSCFYPIYPI